MESTNTQNPAGLKYRATSVQHLIEQMVSLRKRRSKGEDLTIPSVMLQLTSGREIVGFVLDMIPGAGGASVVMQTDINQGRARLVYTDLTKIEAVSFLERQKAKLSSSPKPVAPVAPKNVERPKVTPAITNTSVVVVSDQDIQKLLIKFNSTLTMLFDTSVSVDVGWSTFLKSPRTLGNLRHLIQNFREAIEALATSTRKEELRSQFQSIRFVHGVTFDVLIDSGSVTVQGPLVGSSSEIPSKLAIFNKIEAKMF